VEESKKLEKIIKKIKIWKNVTQEHYTKLLGLNQQIRFKIVSAKKLKNSIVHCLFK
jgi:hypothetical protein